MKITSWTDSLAALIAAGRRKTKTWKRIAAGAVVGGSLALGTSPASAQEINHVIQDPSFDEIDLTIVGSPMGCSGCYAYVSQLNLFHDYPWVAAGSNANSWLYNTAYSVGFPSVSAPRSPDNALHLADGNVFQIIDDTFVSGRTYTLSAWVRYDLDEWVGDDLGLRLFDGTFGTFDGAVIFAAQDYLFGVDIFDDNTWRQMSLTFTAGASADGKPIGVYLGPEAPANRITVDDVTLTSVLGLPGDFNDDGVVDAADYVWWRKNDDTPGKYDEWRTNFGNTASGGAAAGNALSAAVPEPSTCLLVCAGAAGLLLLGRRPARSG